MCTIEKMLVKGIRSFSPDNNNVIEFYKPLTLIVGSNGAGKTTIIECLKQACTGELPPNVGGNGRNWVMDPKVAGESEVKAQIKLRLRNSVQMPFVVVRSFQSLQKKATLQFKSLDATLQTYNRDTQKKEAITYRCADINAMVPSLMGVSKAILDNVIFVHQEESNWPLADGATIKKKFDEIFAATKYTKALETLRKLRLEKTQEAKEMRLKLETLRTHKDAAQKLSSDLQEGQAKITQLTAAIEATQHELAQLEEQAAALDAKLSSLATIAEDRARVEAQMDVVQRNASDKLSRLPAGDYEETDEQLEAFANQWAQEAAQAASMREQTANELRGKQLDQASYEERMQASQQQLSRLQAAADAHASNVADRDAFVRSTAEKMGIVLPGAGHAVSQASAGTSAAAASAGSARAAPGQQAPLPPAAVEGFRSELQHREGTLQAELAALKEQHRSQEQALNAQIDTANQELAQAQQTARMKQQDLTQLERRRENLHQQVMLHTAAPYQAGELQAQEQEVSKKLEAKKAEEARQNFDSAIATQRTEVERLTSAIATLRAERDRVIMADDVASRLRSARNALAAARDKYSALLMGPPAKKLLDFIGNPSPLPHGTELKRLADVALKAKERELAQKRDSLKELEKQLAAAEAQLTATRRERVRADTRAQELRSDLRRAVGNITTPLPDAVLAALNAGREQDAFQGALAHLQELRSGTYDNSKRAEAASSVMQLFARQSQEDGCCTLCKRAFSTDDEIQAMLNSISDMQHDLPERKALYDSQLAQLDAQLCTLNNLLGSVAQLQQQEADLPRLRAGEQADSSRVDAAREETEGLAEEVTLADTEVNLTRRSVNDAGWQLSKQATEVDELAAAAERAAATANAAGSSSAADRTLEDIDAELLELESQARHAEMAKEDLTRRQSKLKDERVRLSEQLAAVMEDLRRATEANRARQELTSQLKDVTDQIGTLTAAIAAASAAIGPHQAQRDQLLAKRDGQRQQHLAEQGRLESQLKGIVATQEGLAAKQRLVDEYAAGNKAAEQRQVAAALDELRQRRDECAAEAAALQQSVEAAATQMAEREATRAEIEAVRDYRRSRQQYTDLEALVRQLKAQAEQVGSRTELESQRGACEASSQELRRKADTSRGSLSVVKENVRAARRGLGEPRYADVQRRYREALIQLKTTEMAAGDLDKYHKALERALLAFHTGKMADINKIVKELWQKTYRGQDIDYIQIKADAEGTARSYNYRVVMVNGGVELDMRGRCSAGQKVLACLIIRLALAETFCLNCGILALDEPTTNLDAENSASLADALRAVMAARREQDNFQLIVITHDEHFAHLIGTRQHAEFLWRITKDDNQRSHIAQEEIVE